MSVRDIYPRSFRRKLGCLRRVCLHRGGGMGGSCLNSAMVYSCLDASRSAQVRLAPGDDVLDNANTAWVLPSCRDCVARVV